MIVLDTHVWVWWVQGDERLSEAATKALDAQAGSGIGVSAISCWEVAMLHARRRIVLPCTLDDWLDQALRYPGIQLLDLTRMHLVDSCRLPGQFHADPADRMIVATARALGCPLVTADTKILGYDHVNAIHPEALSKEQRPQ